MDALEWTSKQQTRREFCARAFQAGALVVVGGLFGIATEGCNPGGNPADAPALPTINAAAVNGTITISTATGSPLAGVGSAALVQYAGGSLLIARTAQDTFVALTAICTHQGCIITGFSGGTYTCPCHGAQYNTSGAVTRGPASASLRSFATQSINNQVVISV